MKPKSQVAHKRREIIAALKLFARRHNMPLAGNQVSPRDAYFMALGALAFARFALDMDGQHKLGDLLAAIKRDNAKREPKDLVNG